MKELRFSVADGVWRVAFAFDPGSRAVLLAAANKIDLWGRDERIFYARLIELADRRFKAYLVRATVPRTTVGGRKRRESS